MSPTEGKKQHTTSSCLVLGYNWQPRPFLLVPSAQHRPLPRGHIFLASLEDQGWF